MSIKDSELKESDIIINYYVEDDFEYFGHVDVSVTSNIIWKRITEITNSPCLLECHEEFVDGYIVCGSHTAKWLPVLITMLRSRELICYVMKDIRQQDSCNRPTYDGSFVFSFYGCNQWTDVKIDDRLPFFSGSTKSIFAVSSNREEFLPSLLEKAYARYLGGYGKFQSTNFIEAVMNFTGGVIEEFQLCRCIDPMTCQDQRICFQKMSSLSDDSVLLCQTSPSDPPSGEGTMAGEGLLPTSHYYLITSFTTIPTKSRSNLVMNVLSSIVDHKNLQTVDLVRLHNPLITGDWGGSYNLGSQEWESMSENVRRHYNLKFVHEFEFWISMNDLCKNMSSVVLCHMPNNRLMDSLFKSVGMWYSFDHSGQYVVIGDEGPLDGPGNVLLKNDQYLLDVISVKEVILKAVLQVDSVEKSLLFNDGCGIIILKVENNRCYRVHGGNSFITAPSTTISSSTRTFTITSVLLRGRYVIIPWRQGSADVVYYLRIYVNHKAVNINLMTEDKPPFEDCFTCALMKTVTRAKDRIMTSLSKDSIPNGRISGNRKCVSCISVNPSDAVRMTMVAAENLEKKSDKICKSYFILKCGNYCYKSAVKTLTNRPIWNDDFIFYRVDPAKEVISVEVFYEEAFGFDKSLGVHSFNQYEISRAEDDNITVSLNIPHDKGLVATSAKIVVKFKSYLPAEFNEI